MSDKSRKSTLIISLVFFGLIFCSISLVNHYNFRTYVYDLGLFNNSIYDYAHFRWNDCMLMQPQFDNLLSDHFTLLPVILSPLYYLFGSYTMLLVQIAAILLGGYGIYRYFADEHGHSFALIAMFHFFTCWGIYSALSFDVHDNVLGSMAVPWLFYYFKKEKWSLASLMVGIILISKENMALWMIFIAGGLLLLNFRDRKKVIVSGIYIAVSSFYFIAVMKFIMPALADHSRGYLHFTYEVLGKGFSEAFSFVLHHPIKTIQLLFENHLNNPDYDGIKRELHLMVLVSGGYCFLLRPQYLFMLIPVYAQKLFSDDFVKWGINNHYSIEFVPILTIMLFSVISTISKSNTKLIVGCAALLISAFFSKIKIDNRTSKWYHREQLNFYKPEHYTNTFNVKLAHQVLDKMIPKNAIVSAQGQIVPHISFRDYIYLFPNVSNADYIVILEDHEYYPLSRTDFLKTVNDYFNNPEWKVIYNENSMVIFENKGYTE